jgi:hypothetical protein
MYGTKDKEVYVYVMNIGFKSIFMFMIERRYVCLQKKALLTVDGQWKKQCRCSYSTYA